MVRCTSSRSATSCTVRPAGAAATITSARIPRSRVCDPVFFDGRRHSRRCGLGVDVRHRVLISLMCAFRLVGSPATPSEAGAAVQRR